MVEIGKITVVKTHASFQIGHSSFYRENYGFILKRGCFWFLLWVYSKKVQNKWVVHYFNVSKKTIKKISFITTPALKHIIVSLWYVINHAEFWYRLSASTKALLFMT